MTLSQAAQLEIERIKAAYPEPRAAMVPALYVAEREFGWLSEAAMDCVAAALGLPKAEVKGAASFYQLYRHREMGRHVIHLCTNISCMILGAERLERLLRTRYGLEPGGTTEDGRFSLLIMECIGACDGAPATQVDSDLHLNLTEESLEEILAGYD